MSLILPDALGQVLDANNSPAPLTTASFPTRTLSVTTVIGTNGITSAAGFSQSDVGGSIVATGIPAGAVIVFVTNASSATFQCPETAAFPSGPPATASGTVTATIRRGFNGTFTVTRAAGYVRQLAVIATNALNILGGSFAFYGSEDGLTNTVVSVKTYTDLRIVKAPDLLNVWAQFKVSFVADRDLTASELIFLSTTERLQDDGPFAIQISEPQEKQGLLLRPGGSFLLAFDTGGTKSFAVGDDKPMPVRQTPGVWGYNAGISGTLTLSGGKRVLKITAIALESAGSISINSGDTIPLPYGSTDKVSSDLTIEPVGNLTDPTIIFTGTDSYFVEYTVAA